MGPPRLLILPDKFRGSISAAEFCKAASAAARTSGWRSGAFEMSDGGEGFARAVAPGGDVHLEAVTGPLGERRPAEWRLTEIAGRRVAVIEAAAACGLELAGGALRNDPVAATTRGVGELIGAALRARVDQVIVGCGGSASTDGGRGALEALGVFPVPVGARDGPPPGPPGPPRPPGPPGPPGPPRPVAGIELTGLMGNTELVVAYDVAIPFVVAAARYGPQKGATDAQVSELETRLRELAVVYRERGCDVALLVGSGSAGGLAGGLAAIGGRLRPGFEVAAKAVGLNEQIATCSAVVTGEGSLDEGSFEGKVVGKVIEACAGAESPRPVLCVVGRSTDEAALAARRSGAVVVSLSERFGTARSFAETRAVVERVVQEWLISQEG